MKHINSKINLSIGILLIWIISSGTLSAQLCQPQVLAEWNIMNCAAFAHSSDYSEFTPTYPGNSGCGSMTASILSRQSGGHSCNVGRSGGPGVAFCIGGFQTSTFVDNHPEALRFSISFGAGDQGKLTSLDFWELAANPAFQININNPIPNNYPTMYGLRVLKNGTQIYRNVGNPTSTSWSLESFDFSNDPNFSYSGATTFSFELYAYAPFGNGATYTIWDLDDFSISGCCTVCDNVTDPGVIAGDQTGCGTFDPAPITSVSLPSGGTGTIEYVWLQNSIPNQTNATVIPNANGPTYDPGPVSTTTCFRRCSRRSGCTDYIGESNWICMTVLPSPTANCSGTDISCNGANDGAASVSATGGSTPYSYLWSNGGTTSSLSGLTAGTYSVTVTDANANGCIDSCSVTVSEPGVLSVQASTTDATCNGANDGSATATPAGGTTPYSYTWSNGGSTASISNLFAGNYGVTVTDANGCTTNAVVTVGEPSPSTATANSTDVTCFGGSDGTVTASASGGTPPFTYLWSNGGTTASLSNLTAGTYDVTITDANGCNSTASTSVTQPSAVNTSMSSGDVSCNGGNDGSASVLAFGGTPGYSYLWSNGGTGTSISNLTAGTYSVTVTDSRGCTGVGTVTVGEPNALVATGTGTDISCNGGTDGSASVSTTGGTPPYNTLWSNGGTTSSISGLVAGTYGVTITDANGCTSSASVSIIEPTQIVAQISSTNASCFGGNGGSAGVTVSGGTPGYTYMWSNGGTTASQNGLTAGTYSVTVTDASGCTTTASTTLTQPSAVQQTTSTTGTTCNGGNDGTASVLAFGGTPPYTYSWANGAATTQTVTGLAAGTYTIVVTDANGCTSNGAATVQEPMPIVGQTTAVHVSCNAGTDGNASVSASGGTPPYSFLWNTGEQTTSIIGLVAGNYTVTITDANGCTGSSSVEVLEPTQMAATTSADSLVCFDDTNGTATVIATGGTPPYSYIWNDGMTTEVVNGLTAGSYSVTVTDANGCTVSSLVDVEEPTEIVVTTIAIDATCGMTDGSASASASGGFPPYTYLWSTGQTGPNAANLGGGTYTVTATDNRGCTGIGIAVVDEVSPTDSCEVMAGDFQTQTQGGWGANPSGNNAGVYLHANFAGAFPSGLTVGCNNTLSLTSAAAITAYLPCGGASAVLTQNYSNPTCLNNSILSNLISATLNVTFDAFDPNFSSSPYLLGDLVIASGPMAGLTVNQVIQEANNAVGGCSSTYSLSVLNQTLENINDNFINGTIAIGNLECPNPCSSGPAPTPPSQPQAPELRVGAWPNPSPDMTNVEIINPNAGEGNIRIFSVNGSTLVRSEPQGYLEAGRHIYSWDGTDRNARPVTKGIYIIEVEVGESREYVKVIRQ